MNNDETLKLARQWLVECLRNGEVQVSFIKNDGSVRDMRCTLKEGVYEPHVSKTGKPKKHNDEVLAVWDIDIGAWRSFNYNSLVSIKPSMEVSSYPVIWEKYIHAV